jgi:hypothetical protein
MLAARSQKNSNSFTFTFAFAFVTTLNKGFLPHHIAFFAHHHFTMQYLTGKVISQNGLGLAGMQLEHHIFVHENQPLYLTRRFTYRIHQPRPSDT